MVAFAWTCSFLAGTTGETLEHALRESELIEEHAMWADRLGIAMHVLAATSPVSLGVDRWSRTRSDTRPPAVRGVYLVALPVATVAAVTCLALVGVVGHLGAQATWHDSPGASTSMRAGG